MPWPWFLKIRIVLSGPWPLDRHAADVEREGRGEVELARAELDDLAGPGLDQGRLGLLRGVRPGLDPVTLSAAVFPAGFADGPALGCSAQPESPTATATRNMCR